MRLGRWVRDLAASRKLLVPVLHRLFHAAVLLLLYPLMPAAPDDGDAADVAFAVDCFRFEAHSGGGGGHYPRNCLRVLREIHVLVLRLRASGAALASHAPPTATMTTTYDVGFLLDPEVSSPGAPAPQPVMTDALHNELSAWLSSDAIQLFDSPSM